MKLLGIIEWEYDPSDVRSVFSMSRQFRDRVLLASPGYFRTMWPSSSFTNSTRSFCPSLGFVVEKSFSDVTGAIGRGPLLLPSLESRNRALSVAAPITDLTASSLI